jgi:hypothetical protein
MRPIGRKPMKKCIIIGLVLAAVFAGVAYAALPGHRVASKTASGQFAVAAVNATIKHPNAVYLRLVGRISSGTIVIACSRGYTTISSNSYDRNRAGLYRVPVRPARPDSCQLIASAGGSGRITVELRAS